MCFNSAKASESNSTNQYDNRLGAEGEAIAVRADRGNVTIDSTSDEAIAEAFDFLQLATESVGSFAQTITESVTGFSQSALQSTQQSFQDSQDRAQKIIDSQNPNDANRIQTITLAALAAVVAYFIWGRKK